MGSVHYYSVTYNDNVQAVRSEVLRLCALSIMRAHYNKNERIFYFTFISQEKCNRLSVLKPKSLRIIKNRFRIPESTKCNPKHFAHIRFEFQTYHYVLISPIIVPLFRNDSKVVKFKKKKPTILYTYIYIYLLIVERRATQYSPLHEQLQFDVIRYFCKRIMNWILKKKKLNKFQSSNNIILYCAIIFIFITYNSSVIQSSRYDSKTNNITQ